MPAYPLHPGQEQDAGSLDALLVEALDSSDLKRAALTLRLTLMHGGLDYAADLVALRRDAPTPVYRSRSH